MGINKTLSDQHYPFMLEALKMAKTGLKRNEIPVGAVIVKDGSIIAKTHNLVEHRVNATRHAEIEAIEMATNQMNSKYLSDCTLYVTLEPCPMCAGAIMWSKLKRVVFGAMDVKSGAFGSCYSFHTDNSLNHTIEIVGGILEKECELILNQFFKSKRA